MRASTAMWLGAAAAGVCVWSGQASAQGEIVLVRTDAQANAYAETQLDGLTVWDEAQLRIEAFDRGDEFYRFDQTSGAGSALPAGPSASASVRYSASGNPDGYAVSLGGTVHAALAGEPGFDQRAQASLELNALETVRFGGDLDDERASGSSSMAEVRLQISYVAPEEGTANSEAYIRLEGLATGPMDWRFNSQDTVLDLTILTPIELGTGRNDQLRLAVDWDVFGDAAFGDDEPLDLYTSLDVQASFRFVPSPASAMLLGLGGVLGVRRRR
ncbi:MAG: hypothetical protein ACF8Q5_02600 [Phycisphaerales bacterium JB040]